MSSVRDIDYDYIIKIIIIGDSNVGKSSLLKKFVKNEFSENRIQTIGVDYATKNIHIHNSNIKLQIWDTAGQERFRSLCTTYYKGSNGVILVFDITDRESFKHINYSIIKFSIMIKYFVNKSKLCIKLAYDNN